MFYRVELLDPRSTILQISSGCLIILYSDYIQKDKKIYTDIIFKGVLKYTLIKFGNKYMNKKKHEWIKFGNLFSYIFKIGYV